MIRATLLRRGISSKQSQMLRSIKGDTQLNMAELEAVHQQFKRKAAGGASPELDLAEFRKAMQGLGITGQLQQDRLWDVFDTDRSGSISFQEYAVGLSLLSKGSAADRYQFIFNTWDTNNDGFISKDEFRRWLGATSSLTGDALEKIATQTFGELDKSGDGLLDFTELRMGLVKLKGVAQLLSFEDNTLGARNSDELELLFLIGERVKCVKGDVLFEQGDKADAFYVLVKGSVEATVGGMQVYSSSTPGDILGSEAILSTSPHYGSLRMASEGTLIKVRSDDLSRVILHAHPAAISLGEAAGEHLQECLRKATSALTDQPKEVRALFEEHKASLLSAWSLDFHALGAKGKIATTSTKNVGSAHALSVAYSPGVAEPCLAIQANPDLSYDYTSRGHLCGIISNGSAVLGLGNIGALASKPVMEGKAVLLKNFGGVDAYDIEVDEHRPEQFIDIVRSLEPTFGAICLEDISAPDCYAIEPKLQQLMSIPVMHDDQHGTALCSAAGLLGALELVGKRIEDVKIVTCGAGAAGFTCSKFFKTLGARDVTVVDVQGVVYEGRPDLDGVNAYLKSMARDTQMRTLDEAIEDADVFLGVSAGNLLTPDMLRKMKENPIVFALANPTPEISRAMAMQTRSDCIVASGRSDQPNQINNVLCFPYLFRGALDVRASEINDEMKMACAEALSAVTREAYGDFPSLNRDYIVPFPYDPRLLSRVSAGVAQAAMNSGVARITLDIDEYRERLWRERMKE